MGVRKYSEVRINLVFEVLTNATPSVSYLGFVLSEIHIKTQFLFNYTGCFSVCIKV